jgi:LacI family transcriptional regulator
VPARNSIRLVDVARVAGVHPSTVSRVLHDSERAAVRPETRERIMAVARDMRYRPNVLARGLKTAATATFGMLVPSLRNPVYSEIVRGAVAEANRLGYVMVLTEDDSTVTEQTWDRLVEEGRIDGIIVASAAPGNPILQFVAGSRVPYVFVNRRVPGSGRNVYMREGDASQLAARHLIDLGHVALAQVAGPLGLDTASRRAAGFSDAVVSAGLQLPALVEAPFEERGAFEAMSRLLKSRARPTGVYVSNLNQAIGALACVRRSGLRVPEDLSLITYDDDPLAEFVEVPLTAIKMPLGELGAAAIGALAAQINGEVPRDLEVMTSPELVLRASTAPPPQGQ